MRGRGSARFARPLLPLARAVAAQRLGRGDDGNVLRVARWACCRAARLDGSSFSVRKSGAAGRHAAQRQPAHSRPASLVTRECPSSIWLAPAIARLTIIISRPKEGN